MKTFKFIFVTLLVIGIYISCGTGQKILTPAEIKSNIENQNYTFHADYVIPSGEFQPKNLSPGYTIKVRKDTIEAYLPYYGRAYQAPMDMTEGGIKFLSKKFEYNLIPGKKEGNWKADIKILDQNKQIILYLDMWENGTSTVTVNDITKQSITFRGDLR